MKRTLLLTIILLSCWNFGVTQIATSTCAGPPPFQGTIVVNSSTATPTDGGTTCSYEINVTNNTGIGNLSGTNFRIEEAGGGFVQFQGTPLNPGETGNFTTASNVSGVCGTHTLILAPSLTGFCSQISPTLLPVELSYFGSDVLP